MKKTVENGVKRITKENGERFINFPMALLAAQAMQYVVALQGNLAILDARQDRGRVELNIHFNCTSKPTIPDSYKYSSKEITSHQYWSDCDNKMCIVRVETYYFKY